MSLASLFSISTQGMQAQSTRLSAQANNIANLQSTGYRPQSVLLSAQAEGGVEARVTEKEAGEGNMQDDVLGIIESAASFALTADVFATGADLWDMLATVKR